MTDSAKNILIWTLVLAAAALLIWGAFKLLSPAYIDKYKYVAKNPPFNPFAPRIGTFNLGRGIGMSYEQSGQAFSPYANGQQPVLKGHDERNAPDQITEKAKVDFFTLFEA